VSIPATLMSIEFEELVELFGTHLSRYRGGGPGTQLEESGLQNNALRAQFGGLRSHRIESLSICAVRAFHLFRGDNAPNHAPLLVGRRRRIWMVQVAHPATNSRPNR
jgi:hypothetical protein